MICTKLYDRRQDNRGANGNGPCASETALLHKYMPVNITELSRLSTYLFL